MPNLNTLAFQGGQKLQSKLQSMTGNPGQMMNPAIYNRIMPAKAGEKLSQYTVQLTPNDTSIPIRGLLTENLSIHVDAKWEELDLIGGLSTNPLLAPLYKYGTMIGGMNGLANVATTGLSTRKIYKQSGYLDISIKFRVVDWKGRGDPVTSAFAVTSMCLPKNSENYTAKEALLKLAGIAITDINGAVAFISKTMGASPEDINATIATISGNTSKFTDWLINKVTMPVEGILKLIPGAYQAASKVVTDPQFLVLASAPSTITIEIGNYFKHNNMVVTDARAEFSKQATYAGPLYADFSVEASSQQAILMNTDGDARNQDIGLKVNGQGRVTTKSTFVGPPSPFK